MIREPSLRLSSSQANWLPEWVQSNPMNSPREASGSDVVETLKRMDRRPIFDSSFDLISPDGYVTRLHRVDRHVMECDLMIDGINPQFLGWSVDLDSITFNLKSTLAQLGVDGAMQNLQLFPGSMSATCKVKLTAEMALGVLTLDYIELGTRLGKLFVVVEHRRVRSVQYFERLLGRQDRYGSPLLVYGHDAGDWKLEVIEGRAVAWVSLQPGIVTYDFEVTGFLPTLGLALQQEKNLNIRNVLRLHQKHNTEASRFTYDKQVLMVRSKGMHIRTMFARVVPELLPKGIRCNSSSIVQPHSNSDAEVISGRTFVFYGTDSSQVELDRIPMEFFTLEPYREYLELNSRMSLGHLITNFDSIAGAFATAPQDPDVQACVFICKGSQFRELMSEAWVATRPVRSDMVEFNACPPETRLQAAQMYLHEQCQFSLLKAISDGFITSQGVLLTKYFISPLLKHFLLSEIVSKTVRVIAFQQFSQSSGIFLSQTDRAMLQDLNTFGVQILYVDLTARKLYEYVHRTGYDCGLFVPYGTGNEYLNATYFGVYGSNLVEGDFEPELTSLFNGIKDLQNNTQHPKLDGKNLSVVTGGGPGVMEMGNRVAKKVGLLSCGLFVDFSAFSKKFGGVINEQKKNPYVDGFMTYRLEKLVERQSDFHLDFPIFCVGGIGTDFEFALENVRRKVGSTDATPIILFGPLSYYTEKVTHLWRENLKQGVVKSSEWLSNTFYVVQTGLQALEVYRRYFQKTLPIGPAHPGNDLGFVHVDDAFMAQGV